MASFESLYRHDFVRIYNVNASVPKTLIQHLIRFSAGELNRNTAAILHAILDTVISPEFVSETSETIQSSEQTVGPYALQDFTLFYSTRYGFRPSKIAFLAYHAWGMSSAASGLLIFPYRSDRPMR
jgi:NAD+ synthase (glutamine-hydrolysing)